MMLRILFFCMALFLVGCKEGLYSGLSEVELNQMRQVLIAAGVDSSKTAEDGGRFTLSVATDDVGPALRALEVAGLPAQKFASTTDILKGDALVSSAGEVRARLGYALSQELSATIASIDGVVSARVHLVMPEKSSLGMQKIAPSSASVFVKHRPGFNMQTLSLSIRQLVTRSVEGLTLDQVSVVLVPSDPSSVSQAKPTAKPAEMLGYITAASLAGLLFGFGISYVWFAMPNSRRGRTLGGFMTQLGHEMRSLVGNKDAS